MFNEDALYILNISINKIILDLSLSYTNLFLYNFLTCNNYYIGCKLTKTVFSMNILSFIADMTISI